MSKMSNATLCIGEMPIIPKHKKFLQEDANAHDFHLVHSSQHSQTFQSYSISKFITMLKMPPFDMIKNAKRNDFTSFL